MKEIPIKKYVRYLFGISIFVFVLNKFYLRPWVLDHDLANAFQIIVLSLPNLIESIVGVLILTGIIMQLRQGINKPIAKVKDTSVYLLAVGIASVYVISQEFKFHNLGGNNVYDIYDVLASVIGLILTFGLILIFGFVEKPSHEL